MPSIIKVSENAVNINTLLNKYKREVKKLRPQDLNIKVFDKDEVLDLISNIFDVTERKKLAQVCPVHLIRNIVPHNDKEFCIHECFSSQVYLLILESKIKDRENYQYDEPDGNYMMCGGEDIELIPNQLYKFNAAKQHAVMVDKLVTGYTFWFRK